MVEGWPITNSMVTGWAVSILLVTLVLWLVGKPSILPSKGQAVVESLIEALRGLFEPIVGKAAFPAVFPLLVTLFIFILFHNWMGLIPGVGTMGWGRMMPLGTSILQRRSFVRTTPTSTARSRSR